MLKLEDGCCAFVNMTDHYAHDVTISSNIELLLLYGMTYERITGYPSTCCCLRTSSG